MSDGLDLCDNPDGQPALPFAAAVQYARTVMAWSREPQPSQVVSHLDLAYGAHRLQRFDVYAPAGAKAAPVLVFWHGGGWTHGYRQWARFMAPRVTDLGLVLVLPSYRLAPEHPLPLAQSDALALLGCLARTLPAYGASARHVWLSGHSAGAHLATLCALRRDTWTAHGIAHDMIQGCLPISGIMDLHDPQPAPGSLEERVYTTVLAGMDPLQDAVHSPLYWCAGNTLPFELSVGEFDSPRVRRSNARMLPLLQAQGGPATLQVQSGQDHFQTHLGLRNGAHPWYARLHALAHSGAPAGARADASHTPTPQRP